MFKILDAPTKAVEVTKGILLRLEEGHDLLLPPVTTAVDETALNLSQITAALNEYETAITAAADCRATMPSLLRRPKKKYEQYPHLKHTIQSWWESAQDLLPEVVAKPDGDIERHCSRRWRTTGIFQIGYQTSRSAYLDMDTP